MTESPEIPPESALPREERPAEWAADVPREPNFAAEIPPTAPPTPIEPPIEQKKPDPIPFAAPPPPVARVEEVEAVRVTRAETRGPTIEVPGVARPPEPPPVSAVPPPTSASGAGPTFQQTSSMPPPAGQPPPASPPPTSPPPPQNPAVDPAASGSNKFWVMVCHLAYLIPGYGPGLAVALIVWVWRRKRDAFLDDQAKEAINFQLVYAGVSLILAGTCLLCVLVPVVWIVGAVLCIAAAVSAADGKRYRYPFLFRLIT
jgi:uncharacterized Tic20 family protein